MADNVDIAAEREEEQRLKGIANIVRYDGHSHTHCDDCGAAIPEARRKALPGVDCCVACAELREAKS